jgi:hypothetical protein
MRGPPAAREIIRCPDQQAPHLTEAPGHHARIRERRDAQRQIEAAADQLDRLIAQMQVDRDLRIGVQEIGKRRPTCSTPNDIGAAILIRPRGAADCASPSASTASASARIWAARTDRTRPVSVNDNRREVRWNRRSPRRPSRREMAFDTVALESWRSAAAPAKEPVSATLAKMAHASRSGSCGIDSGNDVFRAVLFLSRAPTPSCPPARAKLLTWR